MDKHVIYPSSVNLDIVNDYYEYLTYRNKLLVLRDNKHCVSCTDCLTAINTKLQECEDNHYELNLDSYHENPFFLGYKNKHRKGTLIHGTLLTDEQIQNTERTIFNFTVTAIDGSLKCQML